MIIDFHTHVWPDAIAARAIANSTTAGTFVGDGLVSSLTATMDDAGVDAAVTLGIAAKPSHVESVNRFAAQLPARLIGFGSVHPDLSIEENLQSLRSNGLRGVKLNPPFQGYTLDDPRVLDLLDALRAEFVVLTHIGHGGAKDSERGCTPAHVRGLARALPGLRLVAAHLGGYRELDQARELLVGEDVYLDTSWPPGLATLDPAVVRAVIERHGPDKVLFASDWPNGDPARDMETLSRLGLAASDLEAILGGNAAALLTSTSAAAKGA